MSLTPEQQAAVAQWVAAGDSLSNVQKKLREHFDLSLTYMDVRFLVDDLNLALKDPAPKAVASDVAKAPPAGAPPARSAPPEKKGFLEKAKEKLGLGGGAAAPEEAAVEDDLTQAPFQDEELPPAGPSSVSVAVDGVTLIPGAVASGTVTFSDGVTGKWIVDQYGRPGFTEVSRPNYRPTPADAQAFMQQLSAELQKKGF
jgi:hypothetical protein